MLFNSYLFLLIFLPATLIGFACLRRHALLRQYWLLLASLVFYGLSGWQNLSLILTSISINFLLARRMRLASQSHKATLIGGIIFNLVILGYFKYTFFFCENLATLLPSLLRLENIPHLVLPIGISFFTFQQIAFLVDTSRGEKTDYPFAQYALFVVFFPQLIAGPILHHRQIMPRIEQAKMDASTLAPGLTLLILGLAKKVLIADSLAPVAEAVFDCPAPEALSTLASLLGVCAYSFQLYFDFSGYCDMAAGLALCIGITFTPNFNSPYQATNIIEFWRRWHMTLSAFLRDYVYIPLGGNRKGPARRQVNLLATMIIGGFWHGAAWTFVAWGALHGLLLSLNHWWEEHKPFSLPRPAAIALTFCAVAGAWIFFRAPSLSTACAIIGNATTLDVNIDSILKPLTALDRQFFWLAFGAAPLLAFLAPNALSLFKIQDAPPSRLAATLAFRICWPWLLATVILALASLLAMSRISKFLYFQF